MIKYNTWEIFGVDEAWDCESVEIVLKQVKEATGYMVDGDGPAQLRVIINELTKRKIDLGCL